MAFSLQPLDELSAYIDYARARIHPVITEEAGTELVSSYVELRNMGDDPRASEKRITATTRQLESMIRLSEAHARMRFSAFRRAAGCERGVSADARGDQDERYGS
jgi:DNA replication licensing factor MCM4